MGWQVHGTDILRWDSPPQPGRDGYAAPGAELEKVDGHVTDLEGLGLLVLVADCLPVALAGDGRVAMLHCGWRGLAGGIVERAAWSCSTGRWPRRSDPASGAAATRWARRC